MSSQDRRSTRGVSCQQLVHQLRILTTGDLGGTNDIRGFTEEFKINHGANPTAPRSKPPLQPPARSPIVSFRHQVLAVAITRGLGWLHVHSADSASKGTSRWAH